MLSVHPERKEEEEKNKQGEQAGNRAETAREMNVKCARNKGPDFSAARSTPRANPLKLADLFLKFKNINLSSLHQ